MQSYYIAKQKIICITNKKEVNRDGGINTFKKKNR